jgi:hypothetical protein
MAMEFCYFEFFKLVYIFISRIFHKETLYLPSVLQGGKECKTNSTIARLYLGL